MFLSLLGKEYNLKGIVQDSTKKKLRIPPPQKKEEDILQKDLFSGGTSSHVSKKSSTVNIPLYARLSDPWMKEVRDKTWGRGGLPTLPGLYHSTFQPSQRGFF